METGYRLTTDPIPALIRRIAVPASVGYFFNTMYNVVDTYFGGTISTQALAALSLTLPVYFVILAVGTGMSTGATALIGTALGGGDETKARLLSVQGLVLGVAVSGILTGFGLGTSPFLFGVLGASRDYLALCLNYMNAIFAGSVFFILNYMLNAVLNAQGNTRIYRNFLIVGFGMNLVLDPWFIFGGLGLPAMGFSGIAWATVLVQAVGTLYLGIRVWRTGMLTTGSWRDWAPKLSCFKEIARQGVPATVNMATVGVGIFVITYFVSRYGQIGVAAYGIAMRVEQIALLPTIGLNVATLSLVAQNHGAGFPDRIRETLTKALKYGGIMMAGGGAAIILLAPWFMRLFTEDAEVIRAGALYLRIDALVLYAYVVLFVNVAVQQGVKKPMFAMVIGLYRQILAPAVVFTLLSQVLGLGLLGIWWGIFIVTWSAAIIAVIYTRRLMARVL